jgi:hypothetical protein
VIGVNVKAVITFEAGSKATKGSRWHVGDLAAVDADEVVMGLGSEVVDGTAGAEVELTEKAELDETVEGPVGGGLLELGIGPPDLRQKFWRGDVVAVG